MDFDTEIQIDSISSDDEQIESNNLTDLQQFVIYESVGILCSYLTMLKNNIDTNIYSLVDKFIAYCCNSTSDIYIDDIKYKLQLTNNDFELTVKTHITNIIKIFMKYYIEEYKTYIHTKNFNIKELDKKISCTVLYICATTQNED